MKKYKQTIIPETSTKEWRGMSAFATRKKMFDYYSTHYSGTKKVRNQSLNILIAFDRIGAKKTSFGGHIYPKKACLVEVLDDLLRYAEYNNWGERKASDTSNVVGFFNFKAKVYIDGKMEYVHLVVILRNDASFHYSLEINVW
ncbi:MAG: hypothetical protein LBU42_01575 [Prevotellaceae bacterium]|jgi:hypothetical protein|nr:hypothetical protein [Prevotellaceae bacterium]